MSCKHLVAIGDRDRVHLKLLESREEFLKVDRATELTIMAVDM